MSTPGATISTTQAKGFLTALFDLSFSAFITTKIIKLLYIISIVGAAGFALSLVIAAFGVNSGLGILALVLSPVPFLLTVAYARIVLEIVIVFFRIEEHTAEAARLERYRVTSI